MPALFTVKDYVKDGEYHIFNRGIDKRRVFLDEQDYNVFLHYLKKYLLPPPPDPKVQPPGGSTFLRLNLYKQIALFCYCLMPNHFHLLLKQLRADAITSFMRRILTGYSMYFNRKYKRSGPLFSSIFKGILINNEDGLLNVANYIHLNPLELLPKKLSDEEILKRLIEYPYSSLGNYLGKRKNSWVKTEEILKMVDGKRNYQKLLGKPLDFPFGFEEYLASLKVEP